jgi:hypothetical protein
MIRSGDCEERCLLGCDTVCLLESIASIIGVIIIS